MKLNVLFRVLHGEHLGVKHNSQFLVTEYFAWDIYPYIHVYDEQMDYLHEPHCCYGSGCAILYSKHDIFLLTEYVTS